MAIILSRDMTLKVINVITRTKKIFYQLSPTKEVPSTLG
jgi:hypothetical protein